MSSSSLMWTGNLRDKSQVDIVGRQRHPSLHPWMNITDFLLANPSTGVTLQPDIHLSKWVNVNSTQKELFI